MREFRTTTRLLHTLAQKTNKRKTKVENTQLYFSSVISFVFPGFPKRGRNTSGRDPESQEGV